MNLSWSRRHSLLAGLVLIAVTNAIALGGVAWNRSGQPDSELMLTERELTLDSGSWMDTEYSGIDLRLDWRIAPRKPGAANAYGELDWLGAPELSALGIHLPPPIDGERSYRQLPARDVFFVMELAGPAYQANLERVRAHARDEAALAAANPDKSEFVERSRNAQQLAESTETSDTRLYLIEVGLDADALRARFPDRTHYAIVRGRISPTIQLTDSGEREITASVAGLDIDTISVPHSWRSLFERLPGPKRVATMIGFLSDTGGQHPPRYQATVRFGRRYEPWIVDVSRM